MDEKLKAVPSSEAQNFGRPSYRLLRQTECGGLKWQGENRQPERNVAGGQLPDDHNIAKLEEPQAFADAL